MEKSLIEEMLEKARKAQAEFENYTQEQVDAVVKAIGKIIYDNAESMIILPAIDLFEGKAVRLVRGDYARMTVYSDDPLAVAHSFEAAGAEYVHMVDLAGAKDGTTPDLV